MDLDLYVDTFVLESSIYRDSIWNAHNDARGNAMVLKVCEDLEVNMLTNLPPKEIGKLAFRDGTASAFIARFQCFWKGFERTLKEFDEKRETNTTILRCHLIGIISF